MFGFWKWWPSSKDFEDDGYPPKQLKERHLRKHHHRYRPSTCLDKRHKNLELRKRRKKNKLARKARRKNK